MFYWVVGLVGGFCAQNSTAKMIHTCIKKIFEFGCQFLLILVALDHIYKKNNDDLQI